MGSAVVGYAIGDIVGSDMVREVVGEVMGSEVVGAEVGDTVPPFRKPPSNSQMSSRGGGEGWATRRPSGVEWADCSQTLGTPCIGF